MVVRAWRRSDETKKSEQHPVVENSTEQTQTIITAENKRLRVVVFRKPVDRKKPKR